jgi:hypothetical protein
MARSGLVLTSSPAGLRGSTVERLRAIRAVGLALALLLMLLVFFAASRMARSALALRWLLGSRPAWRFCAAQD